MIAPDLVAPVVRQIRWALRQPLSGCKTLSRAVRRWARRVPVPSIHLRYNTTSIREALQAAWPASTTTSSRRNSSSKATRPSSRSNRYAWSASVCCANRRTRCGSSTITSSWTSWPSSTTSLLNSRTTKFRAGTTQRPATSRKCRDWGEGVICLIRMSRVSACWWWRMEWRRLMMRNEWMD